MTTPIFVLGCHRSGTSALSGLLNQACGVSMGELMPATEDNPLGYFEPQGVVDAHRGLLRQLERDWTCPPSTIAPEAMDLSALHEQVAIHRQLEDPWAMKDPTSMFLLDAWRHLGVDEVRLVAVARPPVDTIRSIVKRDGIPEHRADVIVDTYLGRLVEIAEQLPLPVIRFPGEDEPVVAQVRALAESLELPWDDDAARAFFRPDLIRHRSPVGDTSPTYDRLMKASIRPPKVPTADLGELELSSEPSWPLATHLGVHHGVQRNQLWGTAKFESFDEPQVVELLLDGARLGGRRPRRLDLHQLVLPTAEGAGAALLDSDLRPHGVVAHGLLANRPVTDIEFILRSIHISTHPLAELVIDVPNPTGEGLQRARPAPPERPTPREVETIAGKCGWDLVESRRISPGRQGMVLRKRAPTDHELVPMTTELVARAHRLTAMDARLRALETRLDEADASDGSGATSAAEAAEQRARQAEKETRAAMEQAGAKDHAAEAEARADQAKQEFERLRNRRSVRAALAIARPFRPLFRAARSWRR